jgi:flagellar motor component MotA
MGWLLMGAAAAVMGLIAYFGAQATGLLAAQGRLAISWRLFPLIILCAAAYVGVLLMLRVDEAREMLTLAKRKLFQRASTLTRR